MGIEMKTIENRIHNAISNHLDYALCYPSKLYLGYNEAREIDKAFTGDEKEGVVLEYMRMTVIEVVRDSYLEVGL
jgi:hypothetical protein